jgi:hypothetical protein
MKSRRASHERFSADFQVRAQTANLIDDGSLVSCGGKASCTSSSSPFPSHCYPSIQVLVSVLLSLMLGGHTDRAILKPSEIDITGSRGLEVDFNLIRGLERSGD